MKYLSHFSLLFLLLSTPLVRAEIESIDPSLEYLFDPFEDSFALEPIIDVAPSASRAIIPLNDVIALITDPNGFPAVMLQNLLQTPLYRFTFPPVQRDIVDMPMFQQFTERARDRMSFTFKPFITRTFKEYFDDTSTDIDSYVDLQLNALKGTLVRLAQDLDQVALLNQFKIYSILDPFTKIFLQEFRAGAMFEFIKDSYDWSISFRTPLYYLEHNLNMPLRSQIALETDPIYLSIFGEPQGTKAEQEAFQTAFAKKHLISDRFGLGDTRINFEWVLADRRLVLFSLGLRLTLPTSAPFKKGLYGTHFSSDQNPPNVDLYSDFIEPLFSTLLDQNIPLELADLQSFGLAAVDRLSTMLLETSLGNRHHLGIGIFSHNKMKFTPEWTLSTLSSVELVLPGHESRFFNIIAPTAVFESFDWDDTSVATGNLAAKYAFLNQQFINYFFPACYDTVVFPGFVVQSTSCLRYLGQRITFMGGTDLWWHSREWLFHIDAPQSSLDAINKETASQGYAFQSMIWIGLEGAAHRDSSWKVGFKGETTVNSFGVGDEWGASLYFQKEF